MTSRDVGVFALRSSSLREVTACSRSAQSLLLDICEMWLYTSPKEDCADGEKVADLVATLVSDRLSTRLCSSELGV